ncbi:MAG: GAF domain-containing protein [Rickettsiales bacterium]|nr:GAF domain-containing protein [Rickettsiales bacterium]
MPYNEERHLKLERLHGEAIELVQRLVQVALTLSLETDPDKVLETILNESMSIAKADGGTLYILNEDDTLAYEIVRTDSLGIHFGGIGRESPPLKPVPLYDGEGNANLRKQIVSAVLEKKIVNIDDAYDCKDYDFKGTKSFDEKNDYRTKSVLTLPMLNHKSEAIGGIQLINSRDDETGETVSFSEKAALIVRALAAQAAVILDNKQLISSQQEFMEAFIKVIAESIDAKSAYTGSHCARVPVLTEMLAEAACEATEGHYAKFSMSDEEKYELHIAGWLHDCGKIVTPPHIMDKSTKLETIHDRIQEVVTRCEVLKRDAKIAYLEKCIETPDQTETLKAEYEKQIADIDADMTFLQEVNIGGEYLDDDDLARIESLATIEWQLQDQTHKLINDDELYNLSLRRGTINPDERQIMNDHMVHTVNILESMPWPKHLRRVPEYACGHHEKMDGTGYPRGVFAGTMSIPARMMAIADVFEALTAADRPYKPAKTLSEAMAIIAKFKANNHLDPDAVNFFVSSGVYRRYAEMYLPKHLIDEVDEQAIIDLEPEEMQVKKRVQSDESNSASE